MRVSLGIRRSTAWLWGLVAFDIALIFVIAGWQIRPADIGWAILVLVWLLLSLVGAAIALTICYRHYFARWWSWLALLLVWGCGALVEQRVVEIPQAGLSLLGNMLFLSSGASLFIALCLRLYQRDFGISLVGWMTAIPIWSAMLTWRAHGDLIEALFQAMERPDQPSPVGWLTLLVSSACCLIPVALLSIAWHTIVLLWRERRGRMPPCEHRS